jgi:hypothetical protein
MSKSAFQLKLAEMLAWPLSEAVAFIDALGFKMLSLALAVTLIEALRSMEPLIALPHDFE